MSMRGVFAGAVAVDTGINRAMSLMGKDEFVVVIVALIEILVIGASGLLISPEWPGLIKGFSLILKYDILLGLQMRDFLPQQFILQLQVLDDCISADEFFMDGLHILGQHETVEAFLFELLL